MSLKKIIILGTLGIVALVGISTTVLLIKAPALVAHLKPKIEEAGSKAIGADLSIGDLSFSIFPSPALKLEKLKVQTGPENSALLERLYLALKIMPLFEGKLVVSDLNLVQPDITVIKDGDKFWIAGLPKPKSDKAALNKKARADTAKKEQNSNAQPSALPIQFELDNSTIEDAIIKLRPSPQSPAIQLAKISSTSRLSINGTVVTLSDLSFEGLILEKGGFSGKGQLQDLLGQDGKVELTGKLSDLPLEKVIELANQFSGSKNPAEFSGIIDLQYKLNATNKFQDLQTNLNSAILVGAEKLDLKVDTTLINKNLNTKLQLTGFGGSATSDIKIDQVKNYLNAKGIVTAMQLSQLQSALAPKTPKVEGTIENISYDIGATLGSTLKQTLSGNMALKVKDGAISDVNLAADALGGLAVLPLLSDRIIKEVPTQYQSELNSNSTKIKNLSLSFKCLAGRCSTSDISLRSTLFNLDGTGDITTEPAIDIKSNLLFIPEVSLKLVEKVKELQPLLNSENRIKIPLEIRGKIPGASVKPDSDALIKVMGKKKLEDAAGKLLEKALGNKGGKGDLKSLFGL